MKQDCRDHKNRTSCILLSLILPLTDPLIGQFTCAHSGYLNPLFPTSNLIFRLYHFQRLCFYHVMSVVLLDAHLFSQICISFFISFCWYNILSFCSYFVKFRCILNALLMRGTQLFASLLQVSFLPHLLLPFLPYTNIMAAQMLHHFFPSFSCLGIAIFGWGAYSFHNFDSLVISSIPAINIYQALAVCLAVFWVQMMWPILGNQRRTYFFF